MSETIRYNRLGEEDLNLGTGSFEVRLANGTVVTLTQIDLAAILSTASKSTQTVNLTHSTGNNAGFTFTDANGTLLHSLGPST